MESALYGIHALVVFVSDPTTLTLTSHFGQNDGLREG